MEIELKAISIFFLVPSLSHALAMSLQVVVTCKFYRWQLSYSKRWRDRGREHRWFYRSFYGGRTPHKAECKSKHENENKPKTIHLKLWICVCLCGFIVGVVFVVSCWCCWTATAAGFPVAVVVAYVVDYKSILFCFPTSKIHITIYCVTQTMLGMRADKRT